MYIYFDSNGVLKEIITERNPRVGDNLRDKIYVYWDGEHFPTQGWIQYDLPDGTATTETQFYQRPDNSLVPKELPIDPIRNLKYFSYNHTYDDAGVQKLGYLFYEITIPSEVLNSYTSDNKIPNENNLIRARIRWVGTGDIDAMGVIPFSVESTIGILQDNSIDQSQYNYLLEKMASYSQGALKIVNLDPADTLATKSSADGSPFIFIYNDTPYMASIKHIELEIFPYNIYPFEIENMLTRDRFKNFISTQQNATISTIISDASSSNYNWNPYAALRTQNEFSGLQNSFKNVKLIESATDEGYSYSLRLEYDSDSGYYVDVYSVGGNLMFVDNHFNYSFEVDLADGILKYNALSFTLPSESGTINTLEKVFLYEYGHAYNNLTDEEVAYLSKNNSRVKFVSGNEVMWLEHGYINNSGVNVFFTTKPNITLTDGVITLNFPFAVFSPDARLIQFGTGSNYIFYTKAKIDAELGTINNYIDELRYDLDHVIELESSPNQTTLSEDDLDYIEAHPNVRIKHGNIFYELSADNATTYEFAPAVLGWTTSLGGTYKTLNKRAIIISKETRAILYLNDSASFYTKSQIDTMFTATLVYSGTKTVAELNALDKTSIKIGAFYNVSDAGILTWVDNGNTETLEVMAGDNVAWTGTGWDKLTMDLSAYDDKFIAAGFFEVQNYNENTGEITFVYASDLYTMSYDSNTGIMTIEAN